MQALEFCRTIRYFMVGQNKLGCCIGGVALGNGPAEEKVSYLRLAFTNATGDSLAPVAARIRSAETAIFTEWETGVRRAAPSLQDLQSFSLVNSMPSLLSVIADALTLSDKDFKADSLILVSEQHAEQRAKLFHYSREQVFLEYNILREVILAVLEKEAPVPTEARDIILCVLYASFGAAQAEFDRIAQEKIRAADDRARTMEARYLDLVNYLGNAIAWISEAETGRFVFVAKRAESLLGYPVAEWLAEPEFFRKHLHPDDELPMKLAFEKALLSGEEQALDHRINASDGREVWFRTSIQVEKNPENATAHFRGLCFDITPLKRAEAVKEQLLAISNMDLLQLREEREVREKFVTTLTHDLRNPLAVAKITTEMLQDEKNLDGVKEKAARIIRNIDRIEKMVCDLLDANRIRAGHMLPIKFGRVSLVSLAREVVGNLPEPQGNRLRVLAEAEVSGVCSSDGLTRALENLVGNALKYGSKTAPVTIRIQTMDKNVIISVHNEGNPIPQEAQREIFEPFQRTLSADLGRDVGWGIGLTVVRGVAEAHGGFVTVESSEAAGTTFSMIFPLDSSGTAYSATDR